MEVKKTLTFNEEGREKLFEGINQVANAVKVTLGAKGKNVIIDRFPTPHVTKDGVTVAQEVNVDGEIESMGARLIKQVANKTVEDNGDGTSTSCVLAQEIVKRGLEAIKENAPINVKKGMEQALSDVTTYLKDKATPIKDDKVTLKKVALISANGDESIAEIVSSVMSKIKLDGLAAVEESGQQETTVDMIEGTKILSGFASPHFINDEAKNRVVLEDVLVFMIDGELQNHKDLEPIYMQYAELKTASPLLIFAKDLKGEAFSSLVINKVKGNISVAAVRVPGMDDEKHELLKDINSVVGGTIINQSSGIMLKDFKHDMFGKADKVIIDREYTIIIKKDKKGIEKRVKDVKSQIEAAKDDAYIREKLKSRLARLNGAVAVIRVGGKTEVEMKERKDRFDDALGAVSSAMKEGVIAGGGIALLRAYLNLRDTRVKTEQLDGFKVVLESLKKPFEQILTNGDVNHEEVLNALRGKDFNYGYDILNEEIVDMVEKGIIDPVKVVRNALENATSIASMLLTTECVISNKQIKSN